MEEQNEKVQMQIVQGMRSLNFYKVNVVRWKGHEVKAKNRKGAREAKSTYLSLCLCLWAACYCAFYTRCELDVGCAIEKERYPGNLVCVLRS